MQQRQFFRYNTFDDDDDDDYEGEAYPDGAQGKSETTSLPRWTLIFHLGGATSGLLASSWAGHTAQEILWILTFT